MRAVGLVVLGAWLAVSPAHAQPRRDPVAAEALFREGRKAAEAGDAETACRAFGESHRLDPAPGTLLNLAICEEELGRLADAWQHLQGVLDQTRADDERFAMAAERVKHLEPRLPRLVIRAVPAAPSDMKVLRDGVALTSASFGMALPVNPGRHLISVERPGYETRTFEVEVGEGERRELLVSVGPKIDEPTAPGLRPKPAARPASPPPSQRATETRAASKSMRSRSGIGVGLLGVGSSLWVVGAATGGLVIHRRNVVRAECENRQCTQRGIDAARDGRQFSRISTASFVVGTALIGTGVYLTVTGRERSMALTVQPSRSGAVAVVARGF